MSTLKVSNLKHTDSATDNIVLNSDGSVGISTINASSDIFINRSLKFASGYGIDFSATANSSGTMTGELLSDYEEGTFTPTIKGSSSAGTATYGVQNANYTKIGNRVIINVYIAWSSGNGTGTLLMGGLPFTPSPSNTFTGVTIAFQQNITLTASNYMQAHVQNSAADIRFTQTPVGGGALSDVSYDGSGELMVSASYPV
jgi:hypothetical protein